jgi:hypothetical protein
MKGGGNTTFKWTTKQHQTFEELKHKLCTTLVIILPDLHYPFEIETNNSYYAMEVMITQVGHPTTFHS